MPDTILVPQNLWIRRPNQESVPVHPDEIYVAKQVLEDFARQHSHPHNETESLVARIEAMDAFTSAGWERCASVAILDLKQTPQSIMGLIFEASHKFSLWIMVETKVVGTPNDMIVWKPQFVTTFNATAKRLEEILNLYLSEQILTVDADGLRYTGKPPSWLKNNSVK